MKIKKSKKLQLGSIEDEAKACREAFKGIKIGAFVLHCHHEILGESLLEDAENRIRYILTQKPEHERALRLRLFRPVPDSQLKKHKKAYADWQKAYADWQKAEADWQKAEADCRKADTDCQKADTDCQKAEADWQKAYADCRKADADWQKADADRLKAEADLAILVHTKVCKSSCPWDGRTIFPKV